MDYYQSCPKCGAPWGYIQCDHCATLLLMDIEKAARPCLSCLLYTEQTATLIKTYKDKGEQRLSQTFAQMLAHIAPPSWLSWATCLTYITASTSAKRRRGFDHMELIARKLAALWELPCLQLLDNPRAKDQRAFGRKGRISNMEGRFKAAKPLCNHAAIVIDDVFTTGSTMDDACSALEEKGCTCRSLVIARV